MYLVLLISFNELIDASTVFFALGLPTSPMLSSENVKDIDFGGCDDSIKEFVCGSICEFFGDIWGDVGGDKRLETAWGCIEDAIDSVFFIW